MSSSLLLIPLSVVLLALGVAAFFWAVDSDQFEELEEQGKAILDEQPPE